MAEKHLTHADVRIRYSEAFGNFTELDPVLRTIVRTIHPTSGQRPRKHISNANKT